MKVVGIAFLIAFSFLGGYSGQFWSGRGQNRRRGPAGSGCTRFDTPAKRLSCSFSLKKKEWRGFLFVFSPCSGQSGLEKRRRSPGARAQICPKRWLQTVYEKTRDCKFDAAPPQCVSDNGHIVVILFWVFRTRASPWLAERGAPPKLLICSHTHPSKKSKPRPKLSPKLLPPRGWEEGQPLRTARFTIKQTCYV